MFHVNSSVLGNYFIDWLFLNLSVLSLADMFAAGSLGFVVDVLHVIGGHTFFALRRERRENQLVMTFSDSFCSSVEHFPFSVSLIF